MTVLVADDDRALLAVLRQTLAELGPDVRVLACSSGSEAIQILRAEKEDLDAQTGVDVLLTNQKMPGMSGLELIAEARRLHPDVLAILLTAHTDADALLSAINEGRVYRYLVKPWQRAELLATVRNALLAARLRRERDSLLGRLERRLHATTALVELSTQASTPQSHRQLLELVGQALRRILPFDVAAALLVPPGASGPPHMLVMTGAEGSPGSEGGDGSALVNALLIDARDACLAIYNGAHVGAPLEADALVVQVVGPRILRERTAPAVGKSVLRCAIGPAAGSGLVGAVYVASAAEGIYGPDEERDLEALARVAADLSRRLATRMQHERRRMELMVTSMADGVIMTDEAGEIFLINPAARRMLSLPPAEATTPPITAQFLKERLGFYPFELIHAGRPQDGPLREEVRIGEQYLHSIISPVLDGAGQTVGVVLVLRDITEQKALDSRKEEFVSIVSHELRTPLTSIGGALELLAEQYHEGLSDKQTRYLQMARDSAQKLNRIVDDLLDVARAERGKLELRTGAIDLCELVQQGAERFRGAAEHKHVEMLVRRSGPVPIVADADRLGQVLSNLLSNALKFTAGGGKIELEAFGSEVSGDLVGLTVWNSGPPIAEADRERVFDKFEQVQASSTRRVGGTGLGLAISRGIVERHGGQIWVEPSAIGCRFVVTLPTKARHVAETASPDIGVPMGLRKSILVVDDERHATWLLKGALLGARYQVHLAEDAESALVIARERKPDLISVDLQMPGPSGAELVEILRHDPETRKIPILVLSKTADQDRGAAMGAAAVLTKPVTVPRLRETVLTLFSEAGQLRRRVLVIDDEPAIRLICREVLEAHGFLVREAEDGPAALSEARRFRPDLVLVDVMMPGMDGFELSQRLRAERETALVPIIFVSARGQTSDKVRAFKLGADDYMVKPFDSAELVARVEKALARRDFDLGASPTTQLPGSQVIAQEIERRLREHGRFAFCYLDLDNLKAFNDYYGYAKADAVIKQTGDIVREAIACHGAPGDFIGHIAGDDFVLITTVERADTVCAAVIESFDRLVPLYYNKSDRERGFIEARDRFGVPREFPVMSVSIACVTGDGGSINHAELSTRAAAGKQQAKAVVGSAYVRDGEIRLPRPR